MAVCMTATADGHMGVAIARLLSVSTGPTPTVITVSDGWTLQSRSAALEAADGGDTVALDNAGATAGTFTADEPRLD